MALYSQNHRYRILPPVRHAIVLHTIVNFAKIFKTNRRAVAISHDQWAINRGVSELPVRLQRERAVLAIQRADRKIHVRVLDRGVNVVYSDLPCSQSLWIELYAHGI